MKFIDEEGYPTDEFLTYIKEHHVTKTDPMWLINIIVQYWYHGDMGYKIGKPRTEKFKGRFIPVELHTLGWSGNESIINALKENFAFWAFNYYKHITGGHYYFRIKTK